MRHFVSLTKAWIRLSFVSVLSIQCSVNITELYTVWFYYIKLPFWLEDH